jgi:hypothetical protein
MPEASRAGASEIVATATARRIGRCLIFWCRLSRCRAYKTPEILSVSGVLAVGGRGGCAGSVSRTNSSLVVLGMIDSLIHLAAHEVRFHNIEKDRYRKNDTKTCSSFVYRDIKSAVIALAEELGVTFCAYIFLHAIGRSQDQIDLIEYGANTVLGRYNEFLTEKNEHGIAKLDRMSKNGFIYAKEKFQRGLTFRERDRRLDRIISVGFTCDGASHLSSIADIVLGSFRYCVNEPEKDKAGKQCFLN